MPRYGIDVAVRAMALLRDRVPEARLEVYGRGDSRADLERLAVDLGVAERVDFRGYVELRDLPEKIALADVGLVPHRRDVFTDLVLPTKLFEYVAMGKPVVAARTAGIVDDIYHHTIAVLGHASAFGRYVSLSPRDAFDVEYWPLELYKLTLAPPEKELARRIALVTGGASGIGRAVAFRLAREGAHVTIGDLDEAGAGKVAEEIVRTEGVGRALALAMDVTSERSVRRVLEEAIQALPPDYKAAVVLRDIEGLSNQEVAEVLGATVLAVKSRLHRARLALRERLAAHFEARGARV
jgi:RNA polymerase sigma factor (sigma-70 family)